MLRKAFRQFIFAIIHNLTMGLTSLTYAAFFVFFHPFFVSMTDVNYNDKNHELEVSVRIFTDDFENTLRKQHKEVNIDIEHPLNQAQMNGFVNDYIQKHLSFTVNRKPAALSFTGYERENESIWTYFEVKDISSVQKISISNTLLHDYNDGQINIIHIKANGAEKETKLDYPESKAEFGF